MKKTFLFGFILLTVFIFANCSQQPQQEKTAQQNTETEKSTVTQPESTEEENEQSDGPQKKEIVSVTDLQNKVQSVYSDTHKAVANISTTVVTPFMFNMSIPQQGMGSGFLWDKSGHIVTNYHVVKSAESITVSLVDNEMKEAEIVGSDPFTDLAILKIKPDGLPEPLSLGDSDNLDVGEFVVAVGNPFSFEQTLTFGVISALGRVIKSSEGGFISEAIQTDTPINPGNSGGPLINMKGRVIGVNSAIISPSGASAGIGFAIPSNTVNNVVSAIIEKGHYPHPWLGFQSLNLTKRFGRLLEKAGLTVPADKGILIVNVFNNGPADNAGLQGGDRKLQIGNMSLPVGGDIIVALNGKETLTYKQMVLYLENETEIGETITVTFYRDGNKMEKEVKVGERPRNLKVSR